MTFSKSDSLQLLQSGEPFFSSLLQLIANAKDSLQLMFYIFEEDETGKEVLQALKQAASRGVKVKLIVDGYGTGWYSSNLYKSFEQSGIEFRRFAPIKGFRFSSIGRRMHTKVAVSDAHTAIVGGINISNPYSGDEEHAAWLDFAVLVNGPSCKNLASLYQLFWETSFLKPKRIRQKERIIRQITLSNASTVHWLINDRLRGYNQISRNYLSAVRKAQDEIIILNSYFWPGLRFIKALKRADARGVSIKLVLPAVSDNIIFRNATRYFYRILFRMKHTELYEWEKSVLHGKIALSDTTWLSVGSYNLNMLSAFRSIELNAEITDAAFIKHTRKDLLTLIGQCEKVDPDGFKKRAGRLGHIFNMISYYLLHWSLMLLLFFSRRD